MLVALALACAPADTPPAAPEAPVDTGATAAPPRVVMNEVAPANRGSVRRTDGASPDWLELHNPSDADVDVSGWWLSDDFTLPDRHALPAGTIVPARGWRVVWADALPFGLSNDGEGVGLHRPDGSLSDWVTVPPLGDDTAWARLPDGDGAWREVARGTPGQANAALTPQVVELLPADGPWRYLDTRAPPPPDWTLPTFDDTAWPVGPAPLGYGDVHATTLDPGSDPSDKPVTAWFRARFEAPTDTGATRLWLLADDGALVWLDGAEWARLRLPDGPVDPTTLASETASGDTEQQPVRIDLPALAAGPHLLAVEVHQADPGSSDLQLAVAVEVVTWTP